MQIKDFKMDMFHIKGKNAIVTGGNTGLGASILIGIGRSRRKYLYAVNHAR